MESLAKLKQLRSFYHSTPTTLGINDENIAKFIAINSDLVQAIDMAYKEHLQLQNSHTTLLKGTETEQINILQQGFCNFYSPHVVNRYVPLAAKGPWIITTCGRVVYDCGGYGMLGLGHDPRTIIDTFKRHHVMANVMTPSFAQHDFINAVRKEIGHTKNHCPYHSYVCLNSGSEAVSLALRIADVHAKKIANKDTKIKQLALYQGFHGRTDRPAKVSSSCLEVYKKHLHSFNDLSAVDLVPINDSDALEKAFITAQAEGIKYDALLLEPVMGEGYPGVGVCKDFYNKARQLTSQYDTLLIIDSIQAALRTYGVLSIVDYPDFQDCQAPDIEVFSKALNAGQYPLSLVALNQKTHNLYQNSIYGNTMTANPRALDVGTKVLQQLTADLRKNIVSRGHEFLSRFRLLQQKWPHLITSVNGTGLLFGLALNPQIATVVAENGLEQQLRQIGIGVIHGGKNTLRFTPHFAVTSSEIDLVVSSVEKMLEPFS